MKRREYSTSCRGTFVFNRSRGQGVVVEIYIDVWKESKMLDSWLSARSRTFSSSGIRKVFDLGAKLEDPINLSIGQPDFDKRFKPAKAVTLPRRALSYLSIAFRPTSTPSITIQTAKRSLRAAQAAGCSLSLWRSSIRATKLLFSIHTSSCTRR